MTGEYADALQRAREHSPYLSGALDRLPALADLLQRGDFDAALAAAREAGGGEESVSVALRKEKLALSLALGVGDLAGHFDLERVTAELSDFADRALDAAFADAIEARTPGADPAGFAILALGKHGGRELNYSSDIDPIFLYDPDTLPRRERDEPAKAAVRVARHLVETLGQRDEHGYVFRVDLRLRPASEVSPLALPVEAAISHYESSALTWEQAAFIRARAAAGDRDLGNEFLDTIRPFIWRRSLDFGTIEEIGKLSARIRDHYSEGLVLGPGYDIKRGRGGIREVEFFAQTNQLVHGGRNAALRPQATCEALAALSEAGIVDAGEAETMARHYRQLRTVEHRLQMVDDQQTHSLPEDTGALDRVARLAGLESGSSLIEQLRPVVREVADIYDRLVADYLGDSSSDELSGEATKLRSELQELGFPDADFVAAKIERWRGGRVRALRYAPTRKAFEAVLPELMQALADAPEPERALNRLDDIFAKLPSAMNFFRLLEARPGLLQQLVDILTYTPVLADALALRGDLLDGLIDASALDPLGPVGDLAAMLARREAGDAYEQLLDNVRLRVGEKRFALGTQMIGAYDDPLAIAQGYAHIAEAAVCTCADAAIAEFEEVHGRIEGRNLVILALGRLGGEALTHASDLDLIFLFDGEPGGESDGRRPLGATHYFNRLSQRIIGALTVPTASGALYEVDTRLRPSGAQGLLAVSIGAFKQYQREQAWTWEHMALCRARSIYGPADTQRELDVWVSAFLRDVKDGEAVKTDARKMRADMATHKPAMGGLDAKLLSGGLVDLEFIVHALQLSSGEGVSPRLDDAIAMLVDAKLLAPELVECHRLLTRMLVAVRLIAPGCEMPAEASQARIALICGAKNWDALLAAFGDARHKVADEWARVFGTPRDELSDEL